MRYVGWCESNQSDGNSRGTTDLFEASVNMDVRIIWYYGGEQIIILLDVGHHDILKQF